MKIVKLESVELPTKSLILRQCGECGRAIEKAHRIHKGSPVCAICYPRVFKKTRCSSCGNWTRSHKNEDAPVCNACIAKDRVCIRCGKATPIAALIINEKVICASCAPHFREKKSCPRCGTFSARLSRITGISDDQAVCESCQRELAFATCNQCGKHRKMYSSLLDKRSLCKPCTLNPLATHSCPDCGTDVGGLTNGPCFSCSIKRSLVKKQQFLASVLQQEKSILLLNEFIQWVIQHAPLGKISSGFTMYAEFFTRIDAVKYTEVNDKLLSQFFTPEELRRLGYVSKFLADQGYLLSSSYDREKWSDQRRIENILSEASDAHWGSQINQYANWLKQKVEKIVAIRTQRLYLHAATSLMDHAHLSQGETLTTLHIENYLHTKPGQRASLAAYLRFLNEDSENNLKIEVQKKVKKEINDKNLPTFVAELLAAIKSDNSIKAKLAYLAKLLSILYDIPLTKILELSADAIAVHESTTRLRISNMWIELDERIVPVILYCHGDKISNESRMGKLFPGRNINDSLSTAAVNYHLNKLNLPTLQ